MTVATGYHIVVVGGAAALGGGFYKIEGATLELSSESPCRAAHLRPSSLMGAGGLRILTLRLVAIT
jgi:hypothetical protein